MAVHHALKFPCHPTLHISVHSDISLPPVVETPLNTNPVQTRFRGNGFSLIIHNNISKKVANIAHTVYRLRYVLHKSGLESRRRQAIILSSRTSKPALRSNQCSVRRERCSNRRLSGRGAMLITHPYLVPK